MIKLSYQPQQWLVPSSWIAERLSESAGILVAGALCSCVKIFVIGYFNSYTGPVLQFAIEIGWWLFTAIAVGLLPRFVQPPGAAKTYWIGVAAGALAASGWSVSILLDMYDCGGVNDSQTGAMRSTFAGYTCGTTLFVIFLAMSQWLKRRMERKFLAMISKGSGN